MHRSLLNRRDFGIAAGSALIVAAMPDLAFADGDDAYKDRVGKHGHRHRHTDGAKHHGTKPTAQFLQKTWNYDFRSDAIPEDQWSYNFPRHGHANLLIDYKGNWQFAGSFPKQTTHYPSRVTVGVGLRTLHTVIAFTKTFVVTSSGGSFSKQGRDAIIGDLWKDVLKGYDFRWSSDEFADPPPTPQLSPAQYAAINSEEQQSAQNSILDTLATLGTIAAFF